MRTLLLLSLLLLVPPAARAQSTGMQWWNGNGDSIVLGGITVTLDGSGIQKSMNNLHDPPGTDNASFHFTFDPPVASVGLWFNDVDHDESITFGGPLPDHVEWLELDPVGSPIHTVRGFFFAQPGEGRVRWDGPNIASLDFTMSHSSGSIRLNQIDLNLTPFELRAGIDLRSFPDASPAGITLEMAISDPTTFLDAPSFAVERHAMYPCDGQSEIVAVFPRDPGTLRHLRFADANVQSGSSYRYRAIPYPGANYTDFLDLFDPTGWGFEIEAFAAPTSPVQPMTLGHGKLVSFEPAAAQLESCADNCIRTVAGFFPPEMSPYVDSGIDVIVTGTMFYGTNSYGTIADFETAVPTPCTVSVQPSTWTNMKTLYR